MNLAVKFKGNRKLKTNLVVKLEENRKLLKTNLAVKLEWNRKLLKMNLAVRLEGNRKLLKMNLTVKLEGNRSKDISSSENKTKQSAGFIWLFYQYSYSTFSLLLSSNMNSSGHSYASSLPTSEEQKWVGVWFVWYFCNTFWPWAKMAALTVMFSWLFKRWLFEQTRTRNWVKNYCPLLILLTGPMLLHVSPPSLPYLHCLYQRKVKTSFRPSVFRLFLDVKAGTALHPFLHWFLNEEFYCFTLYLPQTQRVKPASVLYLPQCVRHASVHHDRPCCPVNTMTKNKTKNIRHISALHYVNKSSCLAVGHLWYRYHAYHCIAKRFASFHT